MTTKTTPLASSPVSAGVTTSTQRAVLPLCCVADAVQIVVNLTADPSVLSVLVRGGLLPVLVPIAARAPSSVVAVSRKLSIKHCVDSATARVAAAAASQVRASGGSSSYHPVMFAKERNAGDRLPGDVLIYHVREFD